ncbi:MAG: hypothetical protein A2Y62_12015 [Candidatus Fischerbacteria bacterium RBG_13_37_8]|uniref:Methyltransferase type 11 domain-containing protein n=1 Tax=Candidatus Fischerbacteria bacterium RBG_13_37_8 TaxID=1817863 RepID=A0A1F5VDD1_9BACT|nr:MAG: hypothetical protein A2Y62_12015 [Candidatus Fischerbacteria bacterium RBG_13_37_8]
MCSHVIEHLPHYRWYEFLRLCKKVLIQEGNLIIETLNPRSLYGLIEWYWKDPTHQHPVYPEYLQYLMEIIGFNNITITYLTPVPSNVALLTEQQDNQVYEENINRLNTFLHDTIEYYMVANK